MSFAHERRSRRMVDLEAAELHAARERDERFTRRASSASPRRLRRRGRFWDRQYAPIEVESLPPELEDASLLRGAYDTTPRIPPGLGGERWETWRHVPTVVGAPHDDSRASHKPSAPPGLNPDGRAPPMAVSTSIVGKVTAKCYDVDTRDPKRVAQILAENKKRIEENNAANLGTDTEGGHSVAGSSDTDGNETSESEVELEPALTVKSKIFHQSSRVVRTTPEGKMRVVGTVRDTHGVEMLPPPPPDTHFDAIARFRKARHDKETERRRVKRDRSRERAEAKAKRREEKRVNDETKKAARAVKDAAKAAAKASKPKPVNEPALPRIPAPTRTPTSPKPPRQKQKLPRLPPRGVRRRDDAASKLRGAWASGVRSLRDGALHIRAGAVHIGTATARSASSVGKRVHDTGHAIDAAVGSAVHTVANASVHTWRTVRDSDLTQRAIHATAAFLERKPWEPHLARCSWNVAVPPAVSLRVGPGRGPGWFRVLKAGPKSYPDRTPAIAPAACGPDTETDARHACGGAHGDARERSMAILVKALGVPVAAKTPAEFVKALGIEVRNAGDVVRTQSLRTIEHALDSAAKTVVNASRTVGGAAEGVGRKLFSAAERLTHRTEFYEEMDIDMDDPDAPWPNGCYEDLEGYTHKVEAWAVTPHWSKGMRVPQEDTDEDEDAEDTFIKSLDPTERGYRKAEDIAAMMLDDDYDSYGGRDRDDDSYSKRTSSYKLRSSSYAAPLSPLPPQPKEEMDDDDDEYKHLSPLFVPPDEPRAASVPLRSLRLDDYEESLATRVRMLQKSFPEVAEEIADAVYEYAGRIGSDESGAAGLEKVAVEASGDASRRPVDVAAATRVVEELEAASMSVLMHGKIPTGAALRAWLDDVVDGRGAGRGAWREDNSEFFRGESDGLGLDQNQQHSELSSRSNYSSRGFSSSDNQETRYSLSPTMEVRAMNGAPAMTVNDGGEVLSPASRKFVVDVAGALEGWAGREPAPVVERPRSPDPRSSDAVRVMEDRAISKRFIRAWHDLRHEGPVSKAANEIAFERFEKSPATAVKGAYSAAERAIERVENVSKFFADSDSSMDISREESMAAKSPLKSLLKSPLKSPLKSVVKSPPGATRKPWDFSDSSQSDIEVDPATPAPALKPQTENGGGQKPGARVVGGLLSPFRSLKNGLKMLSRQNSPEAAASKTTALEPTVSDPTASATIISSAASESPPASPSVNDASDPSVNDVSVSASPSPSPSPPGSLTASPSFVAAVDASAEKIVASARDAATSRFAGGDDHLKDILSDDDSDSASPSPAMQSAKSKANGAMSTGGSSMVTARTGGSVAFSGGPGFSGGGWGSSATKTIYFDDESPGGSTAVSKRITAGETVSKPSYTGPAKKKFNEADEDDIDDMSPIDDRFSRFPRAIGDKTMDEMLDALDKDLESSMEESPGPVRFNPFKTFKGFGGKNTGNAGSSPLQGPHVDQSDKENEETSGGNSSGHTTDSDTKEWRGAVTRARVNRQPLLNKVASPLKPSRVRSPARETAGYGSGRAAFEREASRLDASMDRGSRRRR